MKANTYLLATPDEIASALVDEKTRLLWDLKATKVEKSGEDCIVISYTNSDGTTINETLKYNFIHDKDGNLVI